MSFIILLLDWYRTNKRPLPWRWDKNAFKVWMSEIILQQTRVNQGLNYYHKFLNNFSNIHELASADENLVLNLWQGLGYYTRARNLHKTAKIISQDYNGEFPKDYNELKKLPGIGPYTAAAIASICFDQKVPAIDGNAYRVYSRLFGLDKDISHSNAHKFFFDFAKNIMPNKNTGDFNEAIMELGATICLPKIPLCTNCPISKDCIAYQTGKVDKFPIKTKKVKIKKRYFHYFFVQNEKSGEFLIKKRKEKDVWYNLFDFPIIETKSKELLQYPFAEENPLKISEVKHVLTHQHLNIKFYEVICSMESFKELKKEYLNIHPQQIKDTPFPQPIASFLSNRFPEMVQ